MGLCLKWSHILVRREIPYHEDLIRGIYVILGDNTPSHIPIPHCIQLRLHQILDMPELSSQVLIHGSLHQGIQLLQWASRSSAKVGVRTATATTTLSLIGFRSTPNPFAIP